jgi:phosphate acetyltransferase
MDAAQDNLIHPILIGPEDKIRGVAETEGIGLADAEIVDVEHSHAAAARAVELIREGAAEILMKGSLHTDEVLGAVVNKTTGIRTERRISHIFLMDVPTYPKLLMITDAAVNIAPDLDAKRDICQNAIELAQTVGVERPKVAILSAVETIRPKIQSTLDAAALCKMSDRGQIKGGDVDGPLAMDNAINLEAAKIKKIDSQVAGVADVLVAPDLEAGNILAKQLIFLAHAEAAGIVLGARVPIILTSRADSVRTRHASAATAVLHAHAVRQGLHTGSL